MQTPDNSVPDLSRLSPAQQRELLAKLLHDKAQRSKRFPMSAGQQGLWHAYRRDPTNTAFNVFLPSRFRHWVAAPETAGERATGAQGSTRAAKRPALNVEALRTSVEWLAQRHASLRTTFSDTDGQLTQTVHDKLHPEFTVQQMLGATDEQAREAIIQETLRPFDLESGPLLRLKLYQLASDDWIVLAITHHIIVDFWSLVLILQEMRLAIETLNESASNGIALPPGFGSDLPVGAGYADFVREQSELLRSPRGQSMQGYWQSEVQRGSPVLELPLDRLRPTAFTGRAASHPLEFAPSIVARMSQLSARIKATNFAVVHAALQVFLSRMSDQNSFYIGSPFSGRMHSKFERTVGFFVNMLPLHAQLEDDISFSELVLRTGHQLLEALENEAVPISQIVQAARIPRDPSRSPLFQVSCTFEKAQLKEETGRASFLFPSSSVQWEFGGLQQESFYIPHQTCHYDLEFVFEQGEQLQGILLYCRDLFDADTAAQMATNFQQLLNTLVAAPDIPLNQIAWPAPRAVLASTQTEEFRETLDDNSMPSQSETLPGLIQFAAQRHPDAVALQLNGEQISYAQMQRRSQDLAEELQQHGVQREHIVPLVTRRGPNAVTAMLAIQSCGAAVVPIDAAQPAVNLREVVADTGATLLVTDSATRLVAVEELDGAAVHVLSLGEEWEAERLHDAHSFHHAATAGMSAYLVYTSGSTGKPKGVVVEHANVVNTLRWRMDALPLRPGDRVLMTLSHQFDAGLGIAWAALTQGATVVWPDDDSLLDPDAMIAQTIRDNITVLPGIPSWLRMMVQHPRFEACLSLRSLWTGGEAMPADLPELVRRISSARLWNLYGPTEAAIEAIAGDVTDHPSDRPVPLGRPIANTEISIVDKLGRPLPSTVPGEIAIAGAGVARGYLNDPALTAQKFVPHAADPSGRRRVYLTGDRGRMLSDGTIEFLGRVDQQVKLRGFRIELGEIEALLETHPLVRRAAVKLLQADTPAANLAAFVDLKPDHHASQPSSATTISDLLRTYLRERLPAYKVPLALTIVEEMPLTSSGKVDRRRLPDSLPNMLADDPTIAPRNPLEAFLEQVWCEVLSLDTIGINRNFFEVGGSSLQAAITTSRLSSELGVSVPTALLFDLADISQVAVRLAQSYPEVIAERFGAECLRMQLATRVSGGASVTSDVHPLIAGLKPGGSRPPLFLVHPPGGIVACYRELAEALPLEQPLYAIRSRGLHGAEALPPTLSAMAADYIEAIKQVQPLGPYVLGGWSLGGLVAYEMSQQLLARGQRIAQLVLLDTTIPTGSTALVPVDEQVNAGLEYGIDFTLDELAALSPEQQLPFLWKHAQRLGVLVDDAPAEVVDRALHDLQGLFHHHVALSRTYRLQSMPVDVLLIRPLDVPFELHVSEDRGWRHLVKSVHVRFVPGHHHSMVQAPHVRVLGATLGTELGR